MTVATSTPPVARSAALDLMRAYRKGLRDLPSEHGFEPLRVEGRLPADFQGTLYLNGPGLFGLFGRPYRHWFDGDGAMTALRFEGAAGVQGAVRLVDSDGLKAERAAGRPLWTSGATPAPWWWQRLGLRSKNVANTKPMVWNDRLFALYEGGLPTELAPDTLATLSESTLDGTVLGHFSAHFHAVPSRRALYNFSLVRGRETLLNVYELPEGQPARRLVTVTLPGGVGMVHDFVATDKHLVFFIPPLRVKPLQILLGLKAPLDTLHWRPELGTTVIVVPIDAPAQVRRFETEPFFQYHFLNAHEAGDEILVDFVHVHDVMSAFGSLGTDQRDAPMRTPGRLYRATVHPGHRTVHLAQRWTSPCEFPQVAPAVQGRAQRFGYLLAAGEGEPQTRIAKVDYAGDATEAVDVGPNQFPSEAVFVPRPGAAREDDGYLVSLVYDAAADRSFAAVYDAGDLGRGTLARAWFAHHVPRPLHGTWHPA